MIRMLVIKSQKKSCYIQTLKFQRFYYRKKVFFYNALHGTKLLYKIGKITREPP